MTASPRTSTPHATSPVLLAEVVRGELVESVHFGSAIAVDPDGAVLFEVGATRTPMFPRSAMKPLQSVGMLDAGLDLDAELLALACASHGGERFHLEGVRRILDQAGLAEADLQNTPGFPLDEAAQAAYGTVPSSLAGNCSGKHAAMLATCVANDWPTVTYRMPDHPLQQRIAATVSELAGEAIATTAVDGCGAPLFGLSLHGLATAFGTIRKAKTTATQRVSTAVSEHPEWVASTTHPNTRLLRALPGSIGKGGAEGVLALAVPDGPAIAIKIADGSHRPNPVLAVALLRTLGITNAELDELAQVPVLGHGKPVGVVRAVEHLIPAFQ
ncbi:asparaginase [Amycolatopsis taiwanensis]|uniref:Asparaginase n=1 Tax=Amycolatopsis taiwanensis TaxID=342230 RepID=A0A9W6VMG9_9PSEU|nr:asparaginase [Amycolatopsis taiwanensis]GLY71526.1 asparaginase [Amycolatopsis taiwanensis]